MYSASALAPNREGLDGAARLVGRRNVLAANAGLRVRHVESYVAEVRMMANSGDRTKSNQRD